MDLREEGDVGVSLGTSDTLFAVVSTPRPSGKEGHVLVNPSDSKTAMLMLCFKNGSLTREHIRDKAAGGSWEKFTNSLTTSAPGNGGEIGIYWLEPEITPTTLKPGFYRFDAQDNKKSTFSPDTDIRAIVEGQFLSLRHHAQSLGLTSPKRIVASGGGSQNVALLQVLADVFQAPVYIQQLTGGSGDNSSMSNTAALGAAYRALHGTLGKSSVQDSKIPSSSGSAVVLVEAAKPNRQSAGVYSLLLKRYAKLEARALEWNSDAKYIPSKL
jgi:xylulokinase